MRTAVFTTDPEPTVSRYAVSRGTASRRPGTRRAVHRLGWYDLTVLGLMLVSIIAVALQLLGR